jgi:hypothetical protein
MRGVRQWRRWLGLAISLIAVLAAITHVVWPSARIDGTTALLLGIALIPWLGELLESIELPGGLMVKYREIARRQDEVEASAREASSTAQAALGAAGSAKADVDELIAKFRDLRSRPFPGRTAELDRLFGALVKVVPDDFDAAQALGSSDAGMRLAGYAYAYYGRAEPELLTSAADALAREETRFNQYWALNTIGRIVVVNGTRIVPKSLIEQLRALERSLPEDSTRRRPVAAVLNVMGDA